MNEVRDRRKCWCHLEYSRSWCVSECTAAAVSLGCLCLCKKIPKSILVMNMSCNAVVVCVRLSVFILNIL